METFSAITFEIYFNGAWTDVSADVRATPHPRINGIGIMGNGFADRVGEPGTCEFSLDNSAANSAGTQGYYNPTSLNSPTKPVPGCPVRVSFTWDGYKRYKFYGLIDNDGLIIETGKYRGRSVKIKASNWFAIASRTKLDLMDYQTNLRADQGIQNVLDKMYILPNRYALEKGPNTYPTVFDITRASTMAAGEVNKLTISGLDFAFIRGGEASGEELVYMSRSTWKSKTLATYPDKNSNFTDSILNETGGTDDILLETGDRLLLEHAISPDFNVSNNDNMIDLQVQHGVNLANRFRFTTYPRSVDAAAVVLWSNETFITIAAGETLTDIRGNYTDPGAGNAQVGGISMLQPVATTDYLMNAAADGSGVDRTTDLVVSAKYGTAEVSYTLTNNNAATSYITKLQARGIGVYTYDKQEKVFDANASFTTLGVVEESLDMPYLDSVDTLFTFTGKNSFFATVGQPGVGYYQPEMFVQSISFIANSDYQRMAAFMFMEPSDVMRIYETMTSTARNTENTLVWDVYYSVTGYDIEILPGKIVKWSPALRPVNRV